MASIYGEYNADGSIKADVDTCAKSGRRVNRDNSVRWSIPNSSFFVRVHQNVAHNITEDDKAAWLSAAPHVSVSIPAPAQSTRLAKADASASLTMENKP